jgi:fructokinase
MCDVLVGAIEAGGTKFICAVGTGPGKGLLARASFPTGDCPAELLAVVADWLKEQEGRYGRLQALGIASFGPLDLHPDSPQYGFITSTPKPGWQNTDLVGRFRAAFDIPIGFDTDVNGAALGEHDWGSASGLSDFVYITIGTGIGAGAMVGGELLHGLVHPEMGHMLLRRQPGDEFQGTCPYHGGCWEGLCSGPALHGRTGLLPEDLPSDHPAWELAAGYIAEAIANITCILSPQQVILGGSVRKGGRLGEDGFFRKIQEKLQSVLNGYINTPVLSSEINRYLVPPLLGDDVGVCGAMALGQKVAIK